MVIVLAALLATVAFVVLVRLLWLSARPNKSTTLVTLAAATLVIGLAVLAATGRLHWLAALGAAVLPFIKRGFGLLRFLPWFRQAFSAYQSAKGNPNRAGSPGPVPAGQMTSSQAREVLGLGSNPTRDEIISAHRRLIQKVHPDRGGSTFLAQQLNEAKMTLLRSR
jgi:hypothetical protein